MLAKCPNARRVLRLTDFGKQKFFNVLLRTHSQIWPVFAKTQKILRREQMINVLYRLQYKFRADFTKNATIARLAEPQKKFQIRLNTPQMDACSGHL
jgi:hypothetical protein